MSNALVLLADEVLLSRARTGDGAAVVNFASRWWPIIGRFAWSMLGNASQAVKVTQEAVGTVLQSAPPLETPVGRLLYRLALWLAIVRCRSGVRAATVGLPVFQALDRLNRIERAAFLLRDVEQLSLSETAAVLEIPVDQVQTHVHRARVLLASLLGDLANAAGLDFEHPFR